MAVKGKRDFVTGLHSPPLEESDYYTVLQLTTPNYSQLQLTTPKTNFNFWDKLETASHYRRA